MSSKYSVALATATCVVIIGLPLVSDARGRRAVIDGKDAFWDDELPLDLHDTALQNSQAFPLPGNMSLRVDTKNYRFVRVNENGFLSISETAVDAPIVFSADVRSVQALPGNVIAGYYADLKMRDPKTVPCDLFAQPAFDLVFELCDVVFGQLNVVAPPNPPPLNLRGIRASWGFFGYEMNPRPPLGIPYDQGAQTDDTRRNTFQLVVIDRSTSAGNQAGDFDIEFTYNRIEWQSATTLVGFKLGPYVLDFGEFYSTFVGGYSDADCPQGPDGTTPAFGPHIAPKFACNAITVAFRNGEPNLLSYTSDLSISLTRTTNGAVETNQSFGLALDIGNAKHDTATNVTSIITLPAGSTFVSATPGTTCLQTNTTLRCTHGSLAVGAPLKPEVTLRSSVSGPLTYSVIVDADQYDPKPSGNTASLQVAIRAPTPQASVQPSGGGGGGGSLSAMSAFAIALAWLRARLRRRMVVAPKPSFPRRRESIFVPDGSPPARG